MTESMRAGMGPGLRGGKSLTAMLGALATAAAVHGQTVHLIHVDASAPTGGDGQSWATAFRDLQDGLDAARAMLGAPNPSRGDQLEILVGPGVYRPDRGTGDRSRSFVINELTRVIGGFAGRNSPNPYDRPPLTDAYLTTLSGDLAGNDRPGFVNMGENSRNVVRIAPLDSGLSYFFNSTTGTYGFFVLEGVAISGGNADGPDDPPGAGLSVSARGYDYVPVRNCLFTGNRSAGPGGAAGGTVATFGGCTFRGNAAAVGGAVAFLSSVVLFDSLLENNAAAADGGAVWGGRIYVADAKLYDNAAGSRGGAIAGAFVSVRSCTIAGNTAARGGGVAVLDDLAPAGGPSSTPGADLTSVLLAHNVATQAGGAVSGRAGLRFCTVVSNRAQAGGALWADSSDADSSIFWNNQAPQGPVASGPGTLTLRNSIIQGGASAFQLTPGMLTYAPDNITSDPTFVNPIGTDPGPTAHRDKDYALRPESPAVDRGGALYWWMTDDAAGRPRTVNVSQIAADRPDLGALEVQTPRTVAARPVLYVNAAAAPGGDGSSWSQAFTDIQQALDTPGVQQVWIARGRYTPDAGTGDRGRALRINRPGIELHGAFAGTETSLDARNLAVSTTTITGDLLANDSASLLSGLDNSLALVQVSMPLSADPPASFAMSGFTFRACRASDAPVSIIAPSVRISDCAFTDNRPQGAAGNALRAGALSVQSPSIQIRRCAFDSNSGAGPGALRLSGFPSGSPAEIADCSFTSNTGAENGGAIHATLTDLTLRRTLFLGNMALGSSRAAGGALSLDESSVRADACRFIGNMAVALRAGTGDDLVQGGAVAGVDLYRRPTADSRSSFTNCLFASNLALGSRGDGGAISMAFVPRIINCTLADNAAGASIAGLGRSQIAGVFQQPAAPGYPGDPGTPGSLITNTIFVSPAYPASKPLSAQWSDAAGFVTRCLVAGLPGPLPPGVISAADPMFVRPAGFDAVPGTADDDYTLRPGSPAIDAADAAAWPSDLPPLDLAGNPRFNDNLTTPNTGAGSPPYLDLGAFEYACPADFNADAQRTIDDIFTYLAAWFSRSPRTDRDGLPGVTIDDLFIFLNQWFAGC